MRLAAPLLALLLFAPPAQAGVREHFSEVFSEWDSEDQILSPSFWKRGWEDLKALPKAPFEWDAKRWTMFGTVIAFTFGSLAVDDTLRDHMFAQRNGPSDRLSEYFTHFGDIKFLGPLYGSAWLLGTFADYEPLKRISADGTRASFYGAGLITPLIVRTSGRALPISKRPALEFDAFHPNRFSFPSGHTTAAFSFATVMDLHLREDFGYWHTPVVYGIAASVGYARVYDHKHYLSDVILGAAIGSSVAYWTVKRSRARSPVRLSWMPGGLLLTYAF